MKTVSTLREARSAFYVGLLRWALRGSQEKRARSQGWNAHSFMYSLQGFTETPLPAQPFNGPRVSDLTQGSEGPDRTRALLQGTQEPAARPLDLLLRPGL